MKEPLVAIVGRPNVGKSTLFNRIVGRRVSIVNDEPGVTRDRIFCKAVWLDNEFTIIDTGGLDFEKDDEISKNIVKQAKLAIDMADVTMFVVDGMTGQNSLQQVKLFNESVELSDIAITKLDGTAKGGVVIGISDQFKIPVKYIGLGEGMEDLQVFRKEEFVKSLFGK